MSVEFQRMEQRWGKRVTASVPAALRSFYGCQSRASIRNASLSGVFVETEEKPAILSVVSVRKLVAQDEWLKGRVVRVEADGVALEWLEPGSQPALNLLVPQQETTADAARPVRRWPRIARAHMDQNSRTGVLGTVGAGETDVDR